MKIKHDKINDKINDKCADYQNVKKMKIFFKDFQCVAGSSLHNTRYGPSA